MEKTNYDKVDKSYPYTYPKKYFLTIKYYQMLYATINIPYTPLFEVFLIIFIEVMIVSFGNAIAKFKPCI
jgi:hypothetical protein